MDHFQQGESGWRLEQVALKFSLDLEAEAGVVIARAKTRAGQYFPGRDRVGTDSGVDLGYPSLLRDRLSLSC